MSEAIIESLQNRYCELQNRTHRKANGQFFTPRWIAKGLAKWVLLCDPSHILDPAVVFGILLDECRLQGYAGRLLGYEIDKSIAEIWESNLATRLCAEVVCKDFLESVNDPIAAAVVNPPYNRFQNRDLPGTLREEVDQVVGLAASGFTNQYALFIYLVVSRLKAGGRAAFIVPSEFLATGYGEQVKEFICRNRRLSHLVLFDTAERVFPDAATTACVLLFDGAPQESLKVWHLSGEVDAEVFHSLCDEDDSAPPLAQICYSSLNPRSNWQGLGLAEIDLAGMVPLGEFGEVKRGVATGANEFFLLSPSGALSHGIAETNLVSCIASAASAPSVVFDQYQIDTLRLQDKACFLFNGLGGQSKEVARYIQLGEAKGLDQRYLTRLRKPWYRLESRQPAALLLAVFGRDGFRVCLNRTEAINLTAFHGFYPRGGLGKWAPVIWLYFQGQMARARFAAHQRSYGDGLKKLEPGDWARLYVPDWRRWSSHAQAEVLELANRVLTEATSVSQPGLLAACAELDSLTVRQCVKTPASSAEVQLSLI